MFTMQMVTTVNQYVLTEKEIHADILSKSRHDVKLCDLQLIWFNENALTILYAACQNIRLQIIIKTKRKHSLHHTPLSYDLFLLISAY